ncbi:MAG: nucleotidyltransferase domain-containing protein [Dethiobacter sp.]|nr:nucleotidyltransferase domain-containing protein [Dethiobacter sp.]
MTPDEITRVVREYLEKQPDTAAAYLFGSVVQGRMTERSDVDLAVIFTAGAGDKPARFDRRLELEIALGELVHKTVQVVDFEAASISLRYQIRKHGQLIVDRDPKRRVMLEAAAIGQYLEMSPMYEFCASARLGRLCRGEGNCKTEKILDGERYG